MNILVLTLIVAHLGLATWAFMWSFRMNSRSMLVAGTLSAVSTLAIAPEITGPIHPLLLITDTAIAGLTIAMVVTIRNTLRDATARLTALHGSLTVADEHRVKVARLHDTIVGLVTRCDLAKLRLEDAARIVVTEARGALGASRGSVWLLENGDETLRCVHLDSDDPTANATSVGLELEAAAYPRYFEAIASGRAVAAADARNDPRTSEFTDGYLRPLGIMSMLDAAVRRSDGVAGVACIEHCGEQRTWEPAEIAFLGEIGDLLGALMARESAVLARNALIVGLAKLADYRDTDTGEHLERIGVCSRLIATAAREDFDEIDDDWISRLEVASSLHDIGKVGIPDDVLLKPGPLTPSERSIMERHTVIGADTIIEIQRCYADDPLLAMGLQITLEHHERWDGKGYPCGLEGEQICLSARIVAVADVYDALTSKRVYKEAMPHERACEIIARESTGQFDPRVVEAFLAASDLIRHARFGASTPAGQSLAA